jgi:tetratricopeptide (TPR) repeat protein
MSIGFIFSGGRSQQPAPKPIERAGGVQAPGKRQTPSLPAPSKEKKAPKDTKQPAGEEGATLKVENTPNLAELRQRGIDLVQQVGEEANGIDDRRSAAIIQAAAADVLWPHRKEPARDLFRRAFETATTHYKETLDDNRQQLDKQIWTSRGDVRVEVIKLINKRDPEMGAEYNEKFIEGKSREEQERATRAAASGQGKGTGESKFFGGNVAATDGLMEAAKTLLNEDAKMATGVARRAADLGVSPAFATFISALSKRDRAAADGLYLHALEVLSSAQAPLPGQLLALSAYPFGEGQIRVRDGSNNSSWGFGKPENFDVNPEQIQKFLTVALGALQRLADPSLTQTPDGASRLSVALYAAKALESKVAAFYPALQEQWQGMTSRLESLNPAGSAQSILQALERENERKEARRGDESQQQVSSRQQGMVDELLERAQKTNNFAQRDSIYSQAATAAEGAGDISRALDIVGRISDLTYRGKMSSWINFNASEKAITEKRYDEARRYALEVNETDYRAYLFFQIAEKVFKDNDRDRASELLEEAARRAVEADDTQEKVKALCGIADLFLKIDQARSFNLAETAVRAANKVPSDKLNLVEGGARMIRTLSNAGSTRTSSTDVSGFDLRKVFGRLAGYDFDRSLALAQAIENKSVRCWAMIAVAESAFVKR